MTPNTRKGVQMAVGFLATLIVAFLVKQYFLNPSFDKRLMQMASEINEMCPLMMDSETRLDNAIALPEKTFQYNYTLVNMENESIDIDEIKGYLEPVIMNNIKTNPDMKIFRDNSVTLSYYYKDRSGRFAFKIAVRPDQYIN